MALNDQIASLDGVRPRATPVLFAATLFCSALLLFAVQPMFAKMVLPSLGGAPSVWSVAMVFFQGALLIGYAYAHLVARKLTVGQGALVHLGVLAAAALTLPIGLAHGFGAPPSTGIGLWLVALFTMSIGLPFVALSASAPLLQSWFAASGHPQARNPYVLYAASNLGSFAALLLYPLALESTLTLRTQAWVWSAGFAGLAVLVAFAAVMSARGASAVAATSADSASTRPTTAQCVTWIALAAIPAGLVIAVTAYISTDVAAAPLLWVLPLALYLLTFVAVFREKPWFSQDVVVRLVPFLVAPLAITLLGDREYWFATMLVNLLALFVLALLCHGELYARRPAPAHLTAYYLWTSVGGVIGGVFAGLLAPYLFSRTYEYPILVVAALFALPGAFGGTAAQFARRIWPALAVGALALVQPFVLDVHLPAETALLFQVMLVGLVGWMLLQRRDPARLAALAAAGFVITGAWLPGLNVLETTRSFFGVHRVIETGDGTHRLLYHGTTIHGAERVRDAVGTRATGTPAPLTYYYFGGPISEAVAAARGVQGSLHDVAAVGLGAGSLACHARPGESWTFFEIDPEVVRLASDPKLFHFLQKCPPAGIVLGDARLTLAASPKQYDLIVLDAFSSDAIPTHLLTREAMRGYLAHLKPHGIITVHISNRHMELAKVVAAVGAAEGLVTFVKADDKAKQAIADLHAAALVGVLARHEADLGRLPQTEGWRRTDAGDVAAWTDDYSDIIGAILRKKLGR